MNKEHRDIIRRNTVNLRDNIADPEAVSELLYERRLFTQVMKEDVDAQTTVTDKTRKILEYIPKRGEDAFEMFYQVLIDTENIDAANFLIPPLTDEEVLPEWPTEQAMTEEIQVKPCERSSEVFRRNWNSTMTYSLKRKIRGRAIIISNTHFDGCLDLPSRLGSEHDRDRLKILFHQLHFDVSVHEDKSAEEIKNVLAAEVGDPYHTTAECFILMILSHGSTAGIYGVDGNVVSLYDITRPFESNTCPNLAGKPKIFFIEADYGGGKLDTGPGISYRSLRNPTKQDILIASATHPGCYSIRNTKYGCWFTQAVIWVFQRYACQEELSSLLKMVNNILSKGRMYLEPQSGIIQAAHYSDFFTKRFYFFPGCHDHE